MIARALRRIWFWCSWVQFNITGLRLFWNQELRDYERTHGDTPVDFS